ncbi:hypothetical protein ABI59_09760 [Acidobacteria bacterium Mor1]|nr:hypothetical protein ABI59_09760 [Acidobacteria bacterium Mor1]
MVIPDDGTVYTIDDDAICGLITIHGVLKCAAGVDAVVNADGIKIDGPNARLECGTRTNRFDGKIIFDIRNNRAFPGHAGNERSILVMNGGTLALHGETDKAGMTRLISDAAAGSTSLTLEDTAGWESGDRIILTTTSAYPDQNESLVLTDNCPGGICGLSAGLQHFHYGDDVQDYPGAGEGGSKLTVDMRAYAANVKRNITIRGANDNLWQVSSKGAHIMIMGSGKAYLDAIELNRMGQLSILGRYPIHWHHTGDIAGQYVRNSSIRNSGSRCIALHNSQNGDVSNNLCYNVQGHALFLENGNEVGNKIDGNLIVGTKEPLPGTELLQSDVDIQLSRWRGPSGLWITNPDNEITNNVVVDAGSGYWMAFIHNLYCYDDPANPSGTANPDTGKHCDYKERTQTASSNVHPVRARVGEFSNNVAIATRVGATCDGAADGDQIGTGNEFNRDLITTGYSPRDENGNLTRETFDGIHAYKSGRTGIYYRGIAGSALIQNAVVVEAPIGWFGTEQQDYFDSLFVGVSQNFSDGFAYHEDPSIPVQDKAGADRLMMGIGLYDGANHFRNVSFDYPAGPMYFTNGQSEITPTPISIFGRGHFGNHVFEDLDFSWQEPYRRINLDAQLAKVNWKDTEGSESNHDVDGSLFGVAGFVRPDIPFNDESSGCTREVFAGGSSSVLRCSNTTTTVKVQMAHQSVNPALNDDFQEFVAVRLDSNEQVTNPGVGTLFDKFQMDIPASGPVNYRIKDLNFKSGSYGNDNHDGNLIWIETFNQSDWTGLIVIDGATATNLASGCATPADYELAMWPGESGSIHKANSVQEIRNFSAAGFAGAYYGAPNGSLVIKLNGQNLLGPASMNPAWFHTGGAKFDLVCNAAP